MTTSEMRADVKELLKRVDEDAKGTRCLTMAEVTLCLDELRRLATPSVASPRAAWKDDALQSRINEAVDEANGVTAAPVGEPGRTPQDDDPPPQCAFCNEFSPKHLPGCLGMAGVHAAAAPVASPQRFDELQDLVAAMQDCACKFLEGTTKDERSIALTTLGAHALVLREDFLKRRR
jgi:hypothetical protein